MGQPVGQHLVAVAATLGLLAACTGAPGIYGGFDELEMNVELSPQVPHRTFTVRLCWEGPSVKLEDVYIHAQVRADMAGASWRFDLDSPSQVEQIATEAPNTDWVGWKYDPDSACLDGTSVRFSLDNSASEPVTVEWQVRGTVVSPKRRADELDLVLVVEEL